MILTCSVASVSWESSVGLTGATDECVTCVCAVEAAGGGGLQLFVDSNVSVDSDLIRKLVNEALTETVAQVLGQKDALDAGEEARLERADPEPRAHEEVWKKNLFKVSKLLVHLSVS